MWVERMVEGDRRDRIRLDAAPWSASRTIDIEATDLTSGEAVRATDHFFMP